MTAANFAKADLEAIGAEQASGEMVVMFSELWDSWTRESRREWLTAIVEEIVLVPNPKGRRIRLRGSEAFLLASLLL